MSTELQDKLQAQLDQAITDQTKSNTVFIDTIAKLKAQIAAEAKPKLRHGDYGYPVGGTTMGRVALTCDNKLVTAGNGSVFNTNVESNKIYYPSPVIGNIFDDLKAMQETVTEFEIGDCRVSIDNAGINITDTDDDEQVSIRREEIAEFILKIRQGEATLKRNK